MTTPADDFAAGFRDCLALARRLGSEEALATLLPRAPTPAHEDGMRAAEQAWLGWLDEVWVIGRAHGVTRELAEQLVLEARS